MGPIRAVLGMMVITTSVNVVTLCIDEIVPVCYVYGSSGQFVGTVLDEPMQDIISQSQWIQPVLRWNYEIHEGDMGSTRIGEIYANYVNVMLASRGE